MVRTPLKWYRLLNTPAVWEANCMYVIERVADLSYDLWYCNKLGTPMYLGTHATLDDVLANGNVTGRDIIQNDGKLVKFSTNQFPAAGSSPSVVTTHRPTEFSCWGAVSGRIYLQFPLSTPASAYYRIRGVVRQGISSGTVMRSTDFELHTFGTDVTGNMAMSFISNRDNDTKLFPLRIAYGGGMCYLIFGDQTSHAYTQIVIHEITGRQSGMVTGVWDMGLLPNLDGLTILTFDSSLRRYAASEEWVTGNFNSGLKTVRYVVGSGGISAGTTIVDATLIGFNILGMIHINGVPYDMAVDGITFTSGTGTLDFSGMGGINNGDRIMVNAFK